MPARSRSWSSPPCATRRSSGTRTRRWGVTSGSPRPSSSPSGPVGTTTLPADERLVARLTRELLDAGDLGDESYDEAVDTLGLPQLFELLTLVGYYDTLALQLRVFRVPAPPA